MDDPIFNDIPFRKLTRLTFATHSIVQGGDSGVGWWNPGDHSQIIPWRINRSIPRFTGYMKDSVNFSPNSLSLLHLWAVDVAGADLFEMNYLENDSLVVPGQAGSDERAAGLRWRVDNPGGGVAVTYEVGDPCCLLWDFVNEDQTERVAVPLMPS